MNRIFGLIILVSIWSCDHTHEHSETMKEVIQINTTMWEELNSLKSKVSTELKSSTAITEALDSLEKTKISTRLIHLTAQKERLKQLDAMIPELKGYEPKCNHEPGETHTHNSLDVSGIPENELLELHKELKRELEKVKASLK